MNNTQKFLCPNNGQRENELVEIDIPTHCPICSDALEIGHTNDNFGSYFTNGLAKDCCFAMYGTYEEVWRNRIIGKTISNASVSSGATCSKCKDFNAYAEANRPNNVFVCYSCR